MIKEKKVWRTGGIVAFLLLGMLLLQFSLKESKQPGDIVGHHLKKALHRQESLIDYAVSGTTAYTFVSSCGRTDYGDLFVALKQSESGAWERSYENDFSELKPWKLVLADVDGDGITDILTSVRKTTHFDNSEKNRLFIFNYLDNKLVKKWTGSQIAGTWDDFITGELIDAKGEELIFVSQTGEGREKLGIYYWFDFGFLLLAESDEYDDISTLSIVGENCIQMTVHSEQETKITLTLKDGKITEVNE